MRNPDANKKIQGPLFIVGYKSVIIAMFEASENSRAVQSGSGSIPAFIQTQVFSYLKGLLVEILNKFW